MSSSSAPIWGDEAETSPECRLALQRADVVATVQGTRGRSSSTEPVYSSLAAIGHRARPALIVGSSGNGRIVLDPRQRPIIVERFFGRSRCASTLSKAFEKTRPTSQNFPKARRSILPIPFRASHASAENTRRRNQDSAHDQSADWLLLMKTKSHAARSASAMLD